MEASRQKQFTVFWTDKDNRDLLWSEMKSGRLRQGWGIVSLTKDGQILEKEEWIKDYVSQAKRTWPDWKGMNKDECREEAIKRYRILRPLTEMEPGDIVVVPYMPAKGKFAIAVVKQKYRFAQPKNVEDFGHVVQIDARSIRVFDYGSSPDSIYVSSKCGGAGAPYRMAVNKVSDERVKDAIMRLIDGNNSKTGECLECARAFKQVILQGPPGTSKTWGAKHLAAQLLGISVDELADPEKSTAFTERRWINLAGGSQFDGSCGAWEIVQFHPSYNYEDFVRGIRAKTEMDNDVDHKKLVTYNVEDRILARMAVEAKEAKESAEREGKNAPSFVLIVDEINRANLAAVLGELIYALEYRDTPISLPYEREGENGLMTSALELPQNLYIIGTMNTADRSIGHIDYAVRRRFAFISCLPQQEIISAVIKHEGAAAAAEGLFKEVSQLFERISGDKPNGCLSQEFHRDDVQIGHTYFLSRKSAQDEILDDLALTFAYQVYPILREYVKDGVLIAQDGVSICNGIKISEQIDQESVRRDVRCFLESVLK